MRISEIGYGRPNKKSLRFSRALQGFTLREWLLEKKWRKFCKSDKRNFFLWCFSLGGRPWSAIRATVIFWCDYVSETQESSSIIYFWLQEEYKVYIPHHMKKTRVKYWCECGLIPSEQNWREEREREKERKKEKTTFRLQPRSSHSLRQQETRLKTFPFSKMHFEAMKRQRQQQRVLVNTGRTVQSGSAS